MSAPYRPGGDPPAAASPVAAVTVRDVAARAGVSTCTVSLALAGHRRIPAPTRQRVLAAAAALGYQPSAAVSRALRAVRSRGHIPYRETIACIAARERLDDPAIRRANNDGPQAVPRRQLRALLRGLEARAAEVGVRLDHFSLRETSPGEIAQVLRARGIGAAIFGPRCYGPERWERAIAALADFHCVVLGPCDTWRVRGIVVAADLFAAGRRSILEAWRSGYRRIAVKRIPLGLDPERRFEAGVRLAGGSLGRDLLVELLDSELDERERVAQLHGTHNPDCCFVGWATDDFIGRLLNRDRAVEGRPGWIDWHASAALHHPAITGIDQRDPDQARHAIDLALSGLELGKSADPGAAAELLLEPRWIAGSSAPGCRHRRLNLLADDPYPTGAATRWEFVSFAGAHTVRPDPEAGWGNRLPIPPLDPGEWLCHGIPFRLSGRPGGDPSAVLLRSATCPELAGRPLPCRVSLRVGRKVRAVYFLHACGYPPPDGACGRYRLVFADGHAEPLPLVAGRRSLCPNPLRPRAGGRGANIQDWHPLVRQIKTAAARPVCLVDVRRRLGDIGYVYTLEWRNPRPARPLARIEIEADRAGDGPAMLAVFAVTLAPA